MSMESPGGSVFADACDLKGTRGLKRGDDGG